MTTVSFNGGRFFDRFLMWKDMVKNYEKELDILAPEAAFFHESKMLLVEMRNRLEILITDLDQAQRFLFEKYKGKEEAIEQEDVLQTNKFRERIRRLEQETFLAKLKIGKIVKKAS
ncbi:MAG: hypothetical protein U0T73_06560 [Chitinophagales bacterium]